MISRFVTIATLVTGAALLCLPAQAQTGSMGQSGTMGSPSTMGGGSMGGQTNTYDNAGSGMGQQAQAAPRRMRGGNAAERQMTECLNNAAAQQRPLDSCRR